MTQDNRQPFASPQKHILANFNGQHADVNDEKDAVRQALEKGVHRFTLAECFTIHHDGREFKSDITPLAGKILITNAKPLTKDQVLENLGGQYDEAFARFRSSRLADPLEEASDRTVSIAFAFRAIESVIEAFKQYPDYAKFIPEVGGRPGEFEELESDTRVYNNSGELTGGYPAL